MLLMHGTLGFCFVLMFAMLPNSSKKLDRYQPCYMISTKKQQGFSNTSVVLAFCMILSDFGENKADGLFFVPRLPHVLQALAIGLTCHVLF